ncbi:hypothetical protein FKW77_003472 [Venturia effusa]|uniref:Nucleoporin Nup54 alpha-helical domain-containing protein n=1 Tax=Venturia effusa TaxID=50376 RepID=A0A517L721_9PEZI|nr:hypothetical protein FKW77_003472 [Venturia effusa]
MYFSRYANSSSTGQRPGRTPDYGNGPRAGRFFIDEAATRNDLLDERPEWRFSCYTGAGQGCTDTPKHLIGGNLEQSFEEQRMLFYAARDDGTIELERALTQQADSQVSTILNNMKGAIQFAVNGKREEGNRWAIVDECNKQTPENERGIFARNARPRSQGASGIFGAPAVSSTFGQASTPSPFGQASTPAAFGQSSTPATFGQASAPTPFGQPSAPTAFGQPSVPGAFGQASAPTAFGQPSLLGQPSPFGKPSEPVQSSGFGQPSQLGQSAAFGAPSTAFGAPSALGQNPSPFGQPSLPGQTSAFGQPSSPAHNSFGANKPQVPAFGSATPFGQASAAASSFGQPSSQPASGVTRSGEPVSVTPQDANAKPRPEDPPEELYEGNKAVFEEAYAWVREHGSFKDGIMPEVAPLHYWVGWGPEEMKFKN